MAMTSKRNELMTLLSGAAAMLAGQAQPARMLGVAIVAMLALLSTHRVSEGQQPKKVPRLCFLTFDPPVSRSTRFEPFFEGLRGLGYEDGQTITIDYLSADGRGELFPALAAECLHLKADIIVASTTPATQAAKDHNSYDPDRHGRARRPGGDRARS
jgi:putative ABC transport system substrate-binding protein